jgi:hypothetical protein
MSDTASFGTALSAAATAVTIVAVAGFGGTRLAAIAAHDGRPPASARSLAPLPVDVSRASERLGMISATGMHLRLHLAATRVRLSGLDDTEPPEGVATLISTLAKIE